MMRTFAKALQPVVAQSTRSLHYSARPVAAAFKQAQLARPSQQLRFASGGSLSKQDITNRVVEILKSFEKVDPAQVKESSSFTTDLGLDSLDAVEVVMAIEEEFAIEIPDEEADSITTVSEAIDYISKTPEGEAEEI